jgi:hypothetical protein
MAPWAVLAVSGAGCAVFGPAGVNSLLPDMLSVWLLLLSVIWLVVRGVRGLAARRQWRRHGGRVIGQQDGPTVAELAERLDGVREQAARANGRLDEYDVHWVASGRTAEAQARRSHLRAVPDENRGA